MLLGPSVKGFRVAGEIPTAYWQFQPLLHGSFYTIYIYYFLINQRRDKMSTPALLLQQKLQNFLKEKGFIGEKYKLPPIIEKDGSAGYQRVASYSFNDVLMILSRRLRCGRQDTSES
jgi:hypothetical protein